MGLIALKLFTHKTYSMYTLHRIRVVYIEHMYVCSVLEEEYDLVLCLAAAFW